MLVNAEAKKITSIIAYTIIRFGTLKRKSQVMRYLHKVNRTARRKKTRNTYIGEREPDFKR